MMGVSSPPSRTTSPDEPMRSGELRHGFLLVITPLKPARDITPGVDRFVEFVGRRDAGSQVHDQHLHRNASFQTPRTVETVTTQSPLRAVQDALGSSLFEMIAGPDGPAARTRIHHTPGPRWFAEDRPLRRGHDAASMFVRACGAF